MRLRKLAVNYKSLGSNLELEDNIFNRILLGVDCSDITGATINEVLTMNPYARPYQQRDIQTMLFNKCTLNRNKPGYGKTFEAIEYCRMLGLKRILVICPKSVLSQWGTQFSRWWPEVEQLVAIGGAGPKRGTSSIFVTNYEQLNFRNTASKGAKKKVLQPSPVWQRCKEWLWDVIIVDESHRIKNSNSQINHAIKQLPSQRRLLLTGTPILNRPDDLWAQLNFMDPRLSGNNYWKFVERFCELEENHFGKKPVGLTPSQGAQQLLAQALSMITVGGENHNVTEGKNYIEVDLDMPPAMRNLYRAVVDLSFDQLDALGVTVKNAMDQIVKQQQITTNIGKFSTGIGNVKFEWIRDWLEDNEGEKVVVFSKSSQTVKALAEYLGAKQCVTYIGEMSETLRTASKDKFVQPSADSPRVLIGTIGALGTGVDGLQNVCRNVIFLDRDWTPGINEQAEDRVNRSGQIGMTNIWLLYMKDTIDRYVEGIQTKKDKDIKEIFEHVRNCIGSGK